MDELKRTPPRRMKQSPQAAPLTPDDVRFFRALRRRIESGDVLEQQLSPAEVALRTGLNKRVVLDMCQRPDGFPNASKPFPNKVLIPVSDVNDWLRRNRVQASAQEAEHG